MPEAIEQPVPASRLAVLWLGMLGPPLVWLIQFESNLILVPWECVNGTSWPIHLVTAVAMLLTAVCALLAWRAREGSDTPQYARFMALGGAGLGAGFVLATLAQGITGVVLTPCQ